MTAAVASIEPDTSLTACLDYDRFKKAVDNACKIATKKAATTTDSLLIRSAHGGAQIIATDLDTYTTTMVRGVSTDGFEVAVDAHRLKAVIDKAKTAEHVSLERDGDGPLKISIGGLSLTIDPRNDASFFGEEVEFRTALTAPDAQFIIKSSLLAKALMKTNIAVSDELSRYYLNGVFMHVTDDKLTFVATDGHMLARYKVPLPSGAGSIPDAGVIVPRAAVTEALRLLGRKNCPADTMVSVTKDGISLLIGEDEMLEIRAIDGSYPDYVRAISGNTLGHKVGVPKHDLAEAIKQASSILGKGEARTTFRFTPNSLSISCTKLTFGTASVTIPVTSKFTAEVPLNADDFLMVLGQIDGGAMIEMGDPHTPVFIGDGADDASTFVLMPFRPD